MWQSAVVAGSIHTDRYTVIMSVEARRSRRRARLDFEFLAMRAPSRSSLRAMRGDPSPPIGVYTIGHDRPAKCTRRAPRCDE
jgi:hypothetical protein